MIRITTLIPDAIHRNISGGTLTRYGVRQIHLDDLEAVKLAEIDSLFLAGIIDTD